MRSSWPASATNRRSRARPASSRPSIALSVSPRRRISSRALGSGSRSPGPLARDLRGPPPHRVHGAQRRSGQEVARDRGEEKRERSDDEQLGKQAVERFLPFLERRSDDEDDRLPLAVDGLDEQSRRLALEGRKRVAGDEERLGAAAFELRPGTGGGRSAPAATTRVRSRPPPRPEPALRRRPPEVRRGGLRARARAADRAPARASRLSSSCSSRAFPRRT